MAKTVALIYGIAEGSWHGKKFRRELIKAGYRLAADSSNADIIIGHSAGCYFLPETATGQVIMLIGPPYWPGRSINYRAAHKIWIDMKYAVKPRDCFYSLKKFFWNLYYLLTQARRTKRIIESANYDVEAIIKTHKAILVRNKDDAWLTPDLGHLPADEPAIIVRDLPGEHDDCWRHPESYVAILASLK
jgi:hypothetical protein